MENEALSRSGKRHLFTVRAETRGQRVVLFSLSWERDSDVFATLHTSANDQESTAKIDLEAVNKF